MSLDLAFFVIPTRRFFNKYKISYVFSFANSPDPTDSEELITSGLSPLDFEKFAFQTNSTLIVKQIIFHLTEGGTFPQLPIQPKILYTVAVQTNTVQLPDDCPT